MLIISFVSGNAIRYCGRHLRNHFAAKEIHRTCGILKRMRARLNLKPGQRGTRKLSARYGDRLVCVRYRYDEEKKKRFRTVELIIEEADWEPKVAEKAVHATSTSTPTLTACVQVKWGEKDLARKLREAGGHWDRQWRIVPHEKVSELGTDPDRVVRGLST